ncbi:hypothetical protein KR054_002381 [Drosophila jambulina]|nr:hypothetical protein KR054_002381 [Drosophila jambulina]
MESERAITDLPLEVLDLIYKYCRFVPHKVNLAQVNGYFGQAFAYHSRNDFKIIPAGTLIRLESWRIILPLCGSNVNEFEGSIYDSKDHELIDLVAMHCPNLQRIKLKICMESVDSVISFLCKLKDNLRSVDLWLARDEKIQPKLVKEMPEMCLLRVLKLRNIHIEDVFHLQKFVNLEELDFEVYREFDPLQYFPTVNIFSICSSMTKLRSLSVVYMSIASEATDLKTPLMSLEELELIYCDIAMDFPPCPKLKSMTFKENRIFDSADIVRRSILNQGESLERLVFFRHYTPYDNPAFLELLRGCKKLRYLKLATRKIHFVLDYVGEIVSILRGNGLEPNDPLELVIDEYFKFKWLRHWVSKFTIA